jgi:hypothetical protein
MIKETHMNSTKTEVAKSEQVVLDYVKGRNYELDFFDASHICIREFIDSPRFLDSSRPEWAPHTVYAEEPHRVIAVFDATAEGLKDAKKLHQEFCIKMKDS